MDFRGIPKIQTEQVQTQSIKPKGRQ